MIKCEPWKYKAENAKPCPFCGGNSVSVAHKEVRYLSENDFGTKKHIMQAYCTCNKCHAKGMPIKYVGYSGTGGYDDDFLPAYSCGDKAVYAWNTRSAEQSVFE